MVRGGVLRGEHAALASTAAHRHPPARICLVEYRISFPGSMVTQNAGKRDPSRVTHITA
jgi:hypothetical protein